VKTGPVKTVLVTGAASGLGYAAALALCGDGRQVFLADINEPPPEKFEPVFGPLPGTAETLRVDVSQSASVAELFEALRSRVESLDMLVHTAGILGETAFIEDLGDAEWRRMMAVNLDGAFYCCREAVRWMKEAQRGRIVLFGSVAALTPTPGALHYSAAKGGLQMMGKTLAREAAASNIRVNVVAPGYFATPMLRGMPEGFLNHILKQTPLKRFGDVEEMGGLISFLASEAADFFTGQVFSPNGGLVI